MTNRKTVLVVDDHDNSRMTYAMYLEELGYRVFEAPNGAEGVRIARERLPDVILMDMTMPVVNGLEASRMLKGEPETAHIPIIAVTAVSLVREQENIRAVCDGLLPKPCPPEELWAEIRRVTTAPA